MFSGRVLYDNGSQHTLLWCNVQAGHLQHQAMSALEWHDLGVRPPDKSRLPFAQNLDNLMSAGDTICSFLIVA